MSPSRENLTAVGVRACVCHGQKTRLDVLELHIKLEFSWMPNRLTVSLAIDKKEDCISNRT